VPVNRYERQLFFDQICSLRGRYRELGPEDRRGIITVSQVILEAEDRLASTLAESVAPDGYDTATKPSAI
jgi:hypothetical protein